MERLTKVFWQKAASARARISSRLVDGKLNGRHLIESDTRISGGVYVSETSRLAITVDGKSDKISSLYQKLLLETGKSGPLNSIPAPAFLGHVMDLVRKTLQNDCLGFLQTFEGVLNRPDAEISLDLLTEMEITDCRVFSLLAGVLTEKLIDDKFVIGKVSIDRNAVLDVGGHVWDRFQGKGGQIIILDATNDYLGPEESKIWPYKRP